MKKGFFTFFYAASLRKFISRGCVALSLLCLIGAARSFAMDPRFEQGARFEAKGEYEKALLEYRSVLAEDPKNSDAYFAAAEVRVKMKDYSGALANYRLAYKFRPTMSVAYEGAAKVYESLGQKAKAEAERAKDPKNKPAENVVSVEESASVEEPVEKVKQDEVTEKKEAKAERESAKAVREEVSVSQDEESDDPMEKGKKLLREGKYEEACLMWREILAKQPGDPGAYYYAGVTRFEMGELDKAEFNLKKGLVYKVAGNEANYYLSRIYQKQNRSNLEKRYLMAYLKKASPKARFREEAEARLAEFDSAKMAEAKDSVVGMIAEQHEPEAVETVETASVAEPIAKKKSAKKDDFVNSKIIQNANMLYRAGSYETALMMFKNLLEKDLTPDERYFSILQMGNIYRELRDFHSAVTRYREVVQEFPDSDWATEAERALEDAVWLEKHASELPRKQHQM